MGDYRYPELIGTAQTKLRMQIAVICAAVGLALIFIAFKFQTEKYLVASAGEFRARHYTHMWFDPSGSLVGVTQRDAALTVERWSGETWQVRLTGSGDAPQWTITPDL